MLAVSCTKVCSISWIDGRSWYAMRFASPKVALVRSQLVVAALVSKNKLPCHLEGCSLVVPVKGLEDVLILCLNSA